MSLVVGWHRPVKREDASSTDMLSVHEEDTTDPFEISLGRYILIFEHLKCFACFEKCVFSHIFIFNFVSVGKVVCVAKVSKGQ